MMALRKRLDDSARSRLPSTRSPSLASLRTVVRGFVGGLVATAVMTLYRLPVFRALPPTAEFWAKYVGNGNADQNFPQGLALHALYGGVAGAVFGALLPVVRPDIPGSRDRVALLSGTTFALGLSAFGARVVFPYLLDDDLDSEESLVFHVGHLVYGLSLGTWVGTREAVGEVYDD